LGAVHLVPLEGGALESIAITIPGGVCITPCREFKRDHVLPIGQRQGLSIGNGRLEYGRSADGNRSVGDFKARENDGRHEGIAADSFREERRNPTVAAEEHLAGPPSLVTARREIIALQAV